MRRGTEQLSSSAATRRRHEDVAGAASAGVGEGDVHGLLGDSFFYTVHRVSNLLKEVNMALDFVEVMSALFELLCLITVVRFSHCTVVFQEIEMISHPAAAAAPATIPGGPPSVPTAPPATLSTVETVAPVHPAAALLALCSSSSSSSL